jgi:cytochrome c-type biogenesis protein CcsB
LVKISKILFSYWTTFTLLTILALGASIATIIENDFGTSTARVLVYSSWWYELVLVLTIINMIWAMYTTKMIKYKAKFIFHFSFVVILIGAGLTRYYGYEGIMQIREGEVTNKMVSLEPFIQVTINNNGKITHQDFMKDFSALGNNNFLYKIPFDDKILELSFLHYKYVKKGRSSQGLLTLQAKIDKEIDSTRLVGQRGQRSGVEKTLNFSNNITVTLQYGARPITIPFKIKLNDFILKRYPGSMSPSSYSSKVTLIDEKNNVKLHYHIYMNHILNYDNFKFFQSSYDRDEKGTILSVNNDPGHWPTYFGYFLLALGLIMNFFDKKSRFSKLTKYIAKVNASSVFVIALLISSITTSGYCENTKDSMTKYLKNHKKNTLKLADNFGKLLVQANGRLKPIDTYAMEVLNKLTRKSEFLGMTSNQVLIGMISRPDIWKDIRMLSIKTPKLKKYLNVDNNRKYVAFTEVLVGNDYKLKDLAEEAHAVDPNKRGTYEKDIIKLDERLNIMFMVFSGELLKIFPKMEKNNTTWYSPTVATKTFTGKEQQIVSYITRVTLGGIADNKLSAATKGIVLLDTYQKKIGKNIYPSQEKIDLEIMFNHFGLFPKLTLAYLFIGIIMFILSFITVFNEKISSKKINTMLFIILSILFTIQTIAMGARWYISGHAPWSNAYEALVYIAWSSMFAGVVFFRKSLLALSATVVMASIFMFTAHLSHIDPQITNMVPVLKSYWLTIHVSIITGSYGFLGLGAMLGFMTLILFIFRDDNKPNIDKTIKHITAINETALIIGLVALTIGNFLGGIWANESWGRYWGWDSKETWAYVSIVVYIIVLHLRIIPKLNRPYIFAVASTLAFSSILMTFFGVNFYLSGMHSYATGDPVPIPTWVYVITTIIFAIIIIASKKRNLGMLRL